VEEEKLPKHAGGRPKGSTKLQPDESTIETITALARIQCVQKEAAPVLKVTEKTFNSFLQYNKKALEAWGNGREEGKASLRRTQWLTMERSVPMQIWLGKQYLGQTDKQEQSGPNGGPVERQIVQILTGVPRGDD
jgi:hypothetical protein